MTTAARSGTVRALVYDGTRGLVVAEQPEPRAGPGAAVVRVDEVGICGTDLKIVSGTLAVTPPLVLGHELIGHVVETGPDVDMPAGQWVMVHPATWCGRCTPCRAGRTNLCVYSGRMGMDIPGGAVGRLLVPVDRLYPLPESLPGESAVLLQVLGTCVHAQHLVDVFPGQRAAVVGLGVSGLMHVQLLRARGLEVVAVGRSPAKLELARRMGAADAISTEEARRRIAAGDQGFDVVVEAAGVAESLAVAGDITGLGGTLVVFGIHGGETPMRLESFYVKEVTVIHARGATALDYQRAIELVASRLLDLSALRTVRYPLADAVSAIDSAYATSEAVKFVLEP